MSIPIPEKKDDDITNVTGLAGATVIPGKADAELRNARLRDLWRLLTHNPKAFAGVCIVLFFVLVAIFGPLFIHSNPSAFSSDVLSPPDSQHWLGTTQTGQD